MAKTSISIIARVRHKIKRIRSSFSEKQMVSVQALPDRQLLALFNIQEVSKQIHRGDVEKGKLALLHYFGSKDTSEWPAPPGIITDLRLNLDTIGRQDLIDRAESILDNRFSPDGRLPRMCSEGKIDWRFNPVSTPEWVWRLNRHQWWPVLGQAYRETGDARYAEAFISQMLDWVESNPPPKKKDENSPTWRLMEAGMRLRVSWIPCFGLFFHEPAFSDDAKLIMLRSMLDHAKFLSLFKTHHNHLLRETNGLAYFSVYFPEFRESEAWKKLAFSRFEAELVKQVNEDGTHVELSTGYQWLVIDEFNQMFRLLNAHNLSLPHENLSTWLGAMYDMLAYIIRPDFSFPEINDGFLRWGNNQLVQAGKLLGRDDLTYIGTSGKNGAVPKRTSAAFKNAGLYIMRSGWKGDARYLLFDAGPYGGWHGHEDKLSIEVSAHGQTFLVDSGSYTYDETDSFRKYFVGSYGHNTVLVDGKSQVRRWDKTNLKPAPTPEQDSIWITRPEFDYAEGSYSEGYGDLVFPKPLDPNIIKGVIHKRRILFVKPYYWIVVDEMLSKTPHDYQLIFHAPPELTVIPKYENRVFLQKEGAENHLMILTIGSKTIAMSLAAGDEKPIQGWYSEGHQRKSPSPVIEYTLQLGGEREFFSTLLYPAAAGGINDLVTMESIDVSNGTGQAYVVSTEGGRDYVMLSDNVELKSFGTFQSRSRVAGVRVDRDGKKISSFESKGDGVTQTLDNIREEER